MRLGVGRWYWQKIPMILRIEEKTGASVYAIRGLKGFAKFTDVVRYRIKSV